MHNPLPSGFTYHGTTYTGDQAAVAAGDNFLSLVIPRIMASAVYQDHGAILIWADETESTDDTGTTMPFVLISPMAKGNAYASTLPYSHASTLKTMDEVFGLAYQTNAIPAGELNAQNDGYNYVDGRSATVYDLSDLFQVGQTVSYQPPQLIGGQMLPGTGGFQLTFSGPAGQPYRVLASDSLSTPRSAWQGVGSGTFGDTNAIFSDPAATTRPERFYLISSP